MSEELIAAGPTPLRHIRLIRIGGTLLVDPPDTGQLVPFELPPIPQSMINWCVTICSQFYVDHQRCLAVLLPLECVSGAWGVGLPRQRASRDSSCWQAAAEDFPGSSGAIVVAGSLQARVFSSGERPVDAVPPVDGVHLILDVEAPIQVLRAFSRVDGVVESIDCVDVITDDAQIMLMQAMGRIQIA